MSKAYATTYCDGDQPGCTWSGTAHASTSSRSAQYRGGGRVRDFYDDFGIGVVAMDGWGMPPQTPVALEYAILPGGQVQLIKSGMRQWQLVFQSASPTFTSILTQRNYLVEAFKPDLVTPAQPIRLLYSGRPTTVYIDAWYVGGLEGSLVGADGVTESPVVRLLSPDPFFYAIGNTGSPVMTSLTIADADYLMKRTAGTWGAISTEFNGAVNALCPIPSGDIYVGGEFTDVGDANGDYIVKVSPDNTITSLTTGAQSSYVLTLAYSAAGILYVGGDFLTVGGIAGTHNIGKWSGTAWSVMGTGVAPAGGEVKAIAVGRGKMGYVFAGGAFVLMGGVADTVYIALWDGTTWFPLGTGTNGFVYALAMHPNNSVYVGGSFTLAGGVAGTAYVAMWGWNTPGPVYALGTETWIPLGTGMNLPVYALCVGPDGTLYAGGAFTTAGGVSANYIAKWNGTSWSPLGTGMNAAVAALAFGSDGLLYIGGAFTTAGGVAVADRIVCWNGTSYVPVPVDFPGSPYVYAFGEIGTRFYVGYSTAGTAYASYVNTVTNNGTATAYPRIQVNVVGGTSAHLISIRNETTGQVLNLDYWFQSGETLVIDLDFSQSYGLLGMQRNPNLPPDPTKPLFGMGAGRKRVYSTYWGDVIGAVLPGSDLATFCLLPGANSISIKVDVVGAPTITATMEWRDRYWSVDGAV